MKVGACRKACRAFEPDHIALLHLVAVVDGEGAQVSVQGCVLVRMDHDHEVPVTECARVGSGNSGRGCEHRRSVRPDDVDPCMPVPARALWVKRLDGEVGAAETLADRARQLRPGEATVAAAQLQRATAVLLV